MLNGIFRVVRYGAPWRDLPERYGPRTTCYDTLAENSLAMVQLASMRLWIRVHESTA